MSNDPTDPVLAELRQLRHEVNRMFNYVMWVALGFSIVLLFLFLKA